MKTRHELFETMLTINAVEHELLRLFDTGVLRGTVHTCIGQEGVAAGIVGSLDSGRDVVCSNHRGHGHYIAHTDDCKGLIAEVMGREEGVCRGVGGSQHLHTKNFYSNGVLGGMAPVATGIAFAEKRQETGGIVVVFMGDGSLGEGVIYEAFNMAALWKLPILYVVEANGYAQSTAVVDEQAGQIADRARSFGITSERVDGNDVVLTHKVACDIVANMRETRNPHFLMCDTYRLAPHSKGDDNRDPEEIRKASEFAPIVRLRASVPTGEANEIERRVSSRIREIVASLSN